MSLTQSMSGFRRGERLSRMESARVPDGRAGGAAATTGFTIIELLVVITLIVILILIAVPSFQTMIYSSEEGMAESQLRNAIRAARDVAIRSTGGNDGAAVFFYEPGGRLTVLPCVKVGEISDWTSAADVGQANSTNITRREVFAAAPGFAPALLPRYWMVRGYVSANSFTNAWFSSTPANLTTNTDTATRSQRNWVFPETGFFNQDANNDGFHRSTFMVRFQAGTGAIVGSSTEPALVLAPRNSTQNLFTYAAPFDTPVAGRDGASDPVGFVRTWLAKPVANGGADIKRHVIGRVSSDMVLARPVMELAMYNEQKLAAAFRVRLDSVTNSIYVDPANTSVNPSSVPMYVGPIDLATIDQWIEGDSNLDGTVVGSSNTSSTVPQDHPEAKLYAIDRYTGVLRPMEVQP